MSETTEALTITGGKVDYVCCDGCAVRWPHEHRCHGTRAMVGGEHTGKTCECPEPFCKDQQR